MALCKAEVLLRSRSLFAAYVLICPACLLNALEPRTQVLPLLVLPGPRLHGLCGLRYG